MTLASLLSETYQILKQTPAGTDRYNNPEYTFTTASTVRGRIAQRGSEEQQDKRDTVITSYVLILPTGVNVNAYDRVRDAAGQTYEVVGAPLVATTPRGPHHLELTLRHIAS